MILTLDIGTALGYYIEGETKARTFFLGNGDERFALFKHFLDSILDEYEIKLIVHEDAPFQPGKAAPIYHGLIGVLKEYCFDKQLQLDSIPVKTIKKEFTGNGNASKVDIQKKCKQLKITFDDDNSADAYAVYWVYNKINKL